IDTVVVPAIGSAYPEPRALLTIDMHVQYLDVIREEDAVAEGWIEKRGRSTVFCRAEVRSASGILAASGSLVYKVSRPETVSRGGADASVPRPATWASVVPPGEAGPASGTVRAGSPRARAPGRAIRAARPARLATSGAALRPPGCRAACSRRPPGRRAPRRARRGAPSSTRPRARRRARRPPRVAPRAP